MNNLLSQHRPKDVEEKDFPQYWENAATTLEPLYKTIKQMVPTSKLSLEELSNPNMYGKMVWTQAQRDFADKILALFPKSLTNP